ncbi:MAG: ATP-binding protein [Chloroflexota bacterium]
MIPAAQFPRFARHRLIEALADTPVVLIHGPRQCGKTTLARTAGDAAGYAYVTFDDAVTLAAARADPTGFATALPARAVLDEVQRVPELFRVIKLLVDRDRQPGRFILTGSANVMFVPGLADSLAGRMETIRLHPLAQAEIAQVSPRFLNRLLGAGFEIRRSDQLREELLDRVLNGGFPAALARATARRRAAWHREYIDAIVQRDVRELAQIRSLEALPHLLHAAAGQTARLFDLATLVAPFQLSRPTIRDYAILLERLFLLDRLPPWHRNHLKRLVTTPKLHIGDTGLASALLGTTVRGLAEDRPLLGQLAETFVFQELRRLATAHEEPIDFYHLRDRDGLEVDVVLQSAGRVAGVDVKVSATVTPSDFRGLRSLSRAAGPAFVAGVVLYDGEVTAPFGERLYAVPIRALWEDG